MKKVKELMIQKSDMNPSNSTGNDVFGQFRTGKAQNVIYFVATLQRPQKPASAPSGSLLMSQGVRKRYPCPRGWARFRFRSWLGLLCIRKGVRGKPTVLPGELPPFLSFERRCFVLRICSFNEIMMGVKKTK